MPNIEIHGLSIRVVEQVKNDIFYAFSNKSYVDEMVMEIYPTIVKDKKNNSQPFIRLVSTPEKFLDEILGILKLLKIDIECVCLDGFYPKGEKAPKSNIDHSRGLCGKPDVPNDTPLEKLEEKPAHCLCCGAVMEIKECSSISLCQLGMYALICPTCSKNYEASQ